MISNPSPLDREVKEGIKRLETIYHRLCIPKTDHGFSKVFAEFGKEIRSNPIFEPYVRKIGEEEREYRKKPDVDSILQKASFNPVGKQALDQEQLKRREQISEYGSLWHTMRFSEVYDISSHERVKSEIREKNNTRDLIDFNEGIAVVADILDRTTNNLSLAEEYLPDAHRVLSGIIEFFHKQQSASDSIQNVPEHTLPHSSIAQTIKNSSTQTLDPGSKNKSKEQNTSTPSSNPVTAKVLLDRKRMLLSMHGKKDIRLELFSKHQPSEHTNQIKLFFELIKGSVAKYTLTETLKLTNKQIEKASSTINTLVRNTWKLPVMYVIYDITSGRYSINPNYPTNLEN